MKNLTQGHLDQLLLILRKMESKEFLNWGNWVTRSCNVAGLKNCFDKVIIKNIIISQKYTNLFGVFQITFVDGKILFINMTHLVSHEEAKNYVLNYPSRILYAQEEFPELCLQYYFPELFNPILITNEMYSKHESYDNKIKDMDKIIEIAKKSDGFTKNDRILKEAENRKLYLKKEYYIENEILNKKYKESLDVFNNYFLDNINKLNNQKRDDNAKYNK